MRIAKEQRGESTAIRRRGFTLIELLTVVAIILLLVSLLLPAINAIRKNAQRARAQGDVATLTQGLKQYFSEYQQWPTNMVGTDNGDVENNAAPNGIPANSNLVAMLGGQDIAGNNPRLMLFLQVPPQALNVDGAFVDPWGHPYRYMCDYNGDGTNQIKFSNGATNLPNVTAAVWSRGPNGSDSNDNDRVDDLTSWK